MSSLKTLLRLVSLAWPLVGAAAAALPVTESDYRLARSSSQAGFKSGKAIYIITNDDQSNAVVAVPISANGSLVAAQGSSTATGAAGASGLTTDGAPAAPDALFSQSAITIAAHASAGNYLFAVNAGNNSVSMLAIDTQDATRLSLVGPPVVFPGQFPNTVAVSPKNRMVCAGMTGAVSGVACASYSLSQGILAATVDALRPLTLTPTQSTPPVGPLNTVSQIFFSEDEQMLYATVKGDGNSTTGYVASYAVVSDAACGAQLSSVAAAGTTSSPNGTAVLFGAAPIRSTGRAGQRADELFVTDASFGAAVVRVDKTTGAATTVGRGLVSGQQATCWVAISPATNTAFVTDVASDRLVEMSLTDASLVGAPIALSASNGDPGLTDLRAAGRFVYALSPGNGTGASVTVLDAMKRQQVQHVSLTSLGLGKSSQGMTILV